MPPLQDASRTCIVMWMGWVLSFFQRNILIGSFLFFPKKIFISNFFPNSTSFSFLLYTLNHFQFVFLLTLYFQSSSNLSSLYIYFFLYKGDNSWETWLELFQRALLIFECSSTNLRKLTWIHHEKSSPLQIYKCFAFLLLLYI